MGKNDFLTPKAIANRIKAKGLQKLRWYCQMCQKQCRDENGFKCHCMSESHQRQMEVFGYNPERFVDGFSEEFLNDFMEHMRRSHRYSRIAATVVYNEYIADRHHVHMNSTKWTTLTEFVKHLGREGLCKVEDTPKGWFITYIDREPETIFKEGLKNKRERADMAEEERHEKEIQEQIERAVKLAKKDEEEAAVDPEKAMLKRDESSGKKIAFSLGGAGEKVLEKKGEKGDAAAGIGGTKLAPFGQDEEDESKNRRFAGRETKAKAPEKSIAMTLIEEDQKLKEKSNRKDYWLTENIVVKVMSKALKEKGFYKQKGVVERVVGKYVGEVKMLEGGAVLKVDQEELETVLPQIGGLVKVVNGAFRGSFARLLSIDADNFCARVEIVKGLYVGKVLKAIDYEDICKVHTQ